MITQADAQAVKEMLALPLDQHEPFIDRYKMDWLKRVMPKRQFDIFLIIRKNPKATGEAYCKLLVEAAIRTRFTSRKFPFMKCPPNYLDAYRKHPIWKAAIQKEKFLIEQKGMELLAKIAAP